MLIESLIKRPKAPIDMGTKTYFFRPLDGNADSPHVCEVDDEHHAARLLSITEGYRVAVTPQAFTRAEAKPTPQDPKVPVKTEGQGAPTKIATPDLTDEQKERVAALRASSVADLRSVIGGIEDVAVLTGTLADEQASPTPRATVVDLLTKRIAALA